MKIEFKSKLADSMRKFVILRQVSGSDYYSQSLLLRYFDDFLNQQKLTKPFISQKLFFDYLRTLSHLTERCRYNRLSVVRQYCNYLHLSEPKCYVPENVRFKPWCESRAIYIFSEKEIAALLALAKDLSQQKTYWETYYTIFGLLYSTGIRIGEALALNVGDVDIKNRRIHIRRGKFRKERWVCLSASTNLMLEQYLKIKNKKCIISSSTPLFIGCYQKTVLQHSSVSHSFKILLERSGIENKPKPRIHDLRHTFAVHRLLQWYQDGVDVNSKLPALATHMGHVNIYSTQHYLHTTPELLNIVSSNFEDFYQNGIISTGGHNES